MNEGRHLPQTTMPALIYAAPPHLPLLILESQGDALETLVMCRHHSVPWFSLQQDRVTVGHSSDPQALQTDLIHFSPLACLLQHLRIFALTFHAWNVILGIATHGASAGVSFLLNSSLIVSKTALSF